MLNSLKFQTNSLTSRMSFLHEKTNKTDIKYEKSHVHTEQSDVFTQKYLSQSLHAIYHKFERLF